MSRIIDPENSSFREAVRTFLQQSVSVPGNPQDGCNPYQLLAYIRDKLKLEKNDDWRPNAPPVDDRLLTRVHDIRMNLSCQMDALLRVFAWASKNEELTEIIGEATTGTQMAVSGLPKTFENLRAMLEKMPLQCNPAVESDVQKERKALIAGVRSMENLFDQTVGQAVRNKQAQREGPGEEEWRKG
jgi:hypothetical protein